MTAAHRFVWVLGNHDRVAPTGLGGDWVDSFAAGPMVFRHEAVFGADAGEVVGHHHPKAMIAGARGDVSAARASCSTDGG